MGNFKRGGFRQGGGNSHGRPKFGGGFRGGRGGNDRSGGRELFPAICSECGKNCEIPFRPTGDKPVYCRDCFGRQRQGQERNSHGSDRSREDFQRDVSPQREHQNEHTRVQSEGGIDEVKRRLGALELKVNRILELVSQKTQNPAPGTPIIEEAHKVAKAKKGKAGKGKSAKATSRKADKK